MSVKCIATYKGNLECDVLHEQSGSILQTEAPLDNNGKGTKYSPTDLAGAALGSCMLTIMGLVASNDNLNIEGAKAEVSKEMSEGAPRRISKFDVNIILPEGLAITDVQKKKIEAAAKSCPVKASLHPDIEINLNFKY